jgi:hypothetical protein
MPRRPLTAGLVLLALSIALAGGCKPKVGGSCSGAAAICEDKQTALFCVDDKYSELACRGEKGCVQDGAVVECDESIAEEKEACNSPDSIACTPDKKEALRCTNRAFVVDETCKGPTGCKLDADRKVTCDNDIADVGDPCHFLGDYACTADKSLVMRCDANKMTPLNTCRGPRQCRIVQLPKQDKVQFLCDDSIAQEGDACDTNGEEACSIDKKSMYVCAGNKFGSPRACTGSAGCTYEERSDTYGCATDSGPATPAPSSAPAAPPPKKHHGHSER